MRTSSVECIILEIMGQGSEHLTAQEIYHNLRSRLPGVNYSTVYRALERLVNSGKLSISDIGTGAAVYERMDGHRHHHLVCLHCRQVAQVSDNEVVNFFGTIENQHAFRLVTNHLILFGYCQECQQKIGKADLSACS